MADLVGKDIFAIDFLMYLNLVELPASTPYSQFVSGLSKSFIDEWVEGISSFPSPNIQYGSTELPNEGLLIMRQNASQSYGLVTLPKKLPSGNFRFELDLSVNSSSTQNAWLGISFLKTQSISWFILLSEATC